MRAQRRLETLADETAVQVVHVAELAYSHTDYRQLEIAAEVLFCLSALIASAARELESGVAQ